MKTTANGGGLVLSARSSDPVHIRETRLQDYAGIAALQSRHGALPRSPEEWTRLWRDNPACRLETGRLPMGWVLENAGGEIVGSIASFPFLYSFHGRNLHVATCGDWFVDVPYRGDSLQLMLRFMQQEGVDVVLTTTAVAAAETVLQGFRWDRAPVGAWNRSAFWVANYRALARIALRAASLPCAASLSYPAAAALMGWSWMTTRRASAGPSLPIDLCPEFDSRFDAFWLELKSQKQDLFFAVRARETLVWHFGRLTPGEDLWILTASTGARLAAYAIFDRKDNISLGFSRVRLIDFQALEGYSGMLGPFLRWMLNECRRRGIGLLENTGCWIERPGLPRVPVPHHRNLPAWSYYYKARDRDLAQALRDPGVWDPSSFDGDVCL